MTHFVDVTEMGWLLAIMLVLLARSIATAIHRHRTDAANMKRIDEQWDLLERDHND